VLLVSHDEAFLEKITVTDWHLTRDDDGDTRLKITG
jgi:ATPase subunit of ABC transporter with duplicated ATPase domains